MSASTQHLSSNSWRSLQDVSARVMYAEFVPNTTVFCCIAPSDCLENIFSTALCLLVWFSHVFPLYSYVWSWGMATCKVHIFHFSVQSVESSGSFSHPLWSRQCLEKHSPNVLLATKIYSLKKHIESLAGMETIVKGLLEPMLGWNGTCISGENGKVFG